MTYKQRRFVEEYRGDGKQAAIKAGYSEKSAGNTAVYLLGKAEIQEALKNYQKKKQEEESSKNEKDKLREYEGKPLSKENLQYFWTRIILSDFESTGDRLKASELLGRTYALFIERLNIRPELPYADFTPEELSLIAAGIPALKIIDDRKKSEMIEFDRK